MFLEILLLALHRSRDRNFDSGAREERREGRDGANGEARAPKVNACYDFGRSGECRRAQCPFAHVRGEGAVSKPAREPREGSRDTKQQCFTFAETGDCKFGDQCRFAHGDEPPRERRGFGGGFRDGGSRGYGGFRDGGSRGYGGERDGGRGNKICYNFRDRGECNRGADCKFSHDTDAQDSFGGGRANGTLISLVAEHEFG